MRLVIVDQSFVGVGGHHAEYTLCIAKEAAKAADVTVLANDRCEVESFGGVDIRPSFRLPWTQSQHWRPPAGYDPTVSFPAWSFLADLQRALAGLDLTPQDHVFIHSIGFTEIEDLLALALTAERRRLPQFDILLRRDLNEIRSAAARFERFVAYVKAFAGVGLWPDRVRFFTDTDELSAQYSAASGTPFATLAIPFDQEAMRAAFAARDAGGPDWPLVVGYLGDARPEKGYQFLPAVAAALQQAQLLGGKVRLRCQSNYNMPGGETPAMPEARRALEGFGPAVELLYEPLDQDEYYRQLAEMDVVILPYVAERYRNRSSGIFVQAAAAGKITVVPAGTTMAAAAQRCGMRNCVVYDGPAALPDAVRRAVEQHEALAASADYRAAWCAANSAAALVEALLGGAAPPEDGAAARQRKAPLVLHVIDGHSTRFSTGAAAVQQAQSRFLRAAGYRVATIFAARTFPSDQLLEGWIEHNYRYWLLSGCAFSWLVYFTQPPPGSGGSLEDELRASETLSVPETLRGLLAAGAVDLVWTNYVTTVPFLRTLGVLGRVPVICETHDIQSFQFAIRGERQLDEADLEAELLQLRDCDRILSLSGSESQLLARRLDPARIATLVPPVMQEPLSAADMAGAQDLAELVDMARRGADLADPSTIRRGSDTYGSDLLRHAESLDLLFVSSVHPPNMQSFDWFLDNAYATHLAARGVTLLLAGSLSDTEWARQRQRRFPGTLFLAGRVEDLRPLYAAARIVILPITQGAGVNIKTAEALGLGKPVVATSLALRGLPTLAKSVPCFDDAAGFARRIVELLGDPALRMREASRNWQLSIGQRNAQAYFDALSDIFGQLLRRRPAAAADSWPAPSWEFSEWDGDIAALNRMATALVDELPELRGETRASEATLGKPGMRGKFARIVGTLLRRRAAPLDPGGAVPRDGSRPDARLFSRHLRGLSSNYSYAALLAQLATAPESNAGPDPRAVLLGAGDGPVEMDLSAPMPGMGWHPAENDAAAHRWTGPEPRFTLELFPPGRRFKCRMELIPGRPENFDNFTVRRNGDPVPYEHRKAEGKMVVEFPIPAGAVAGDAEIAIFDFSHERVFRPAEHGGGDMRSLGFAVCSIRFEPADGGRDGEVAAPGPARDPAATVAPQAPAAGATVDAPPRALVIDDSVPEPDKDAGSNAVLQHILSLQRLGYAVGFVPADNMAEIEPYTGDLQRRGVECFHRPAYASVDDVLAGRREGFDLAYLHRCSNASQYGAAIRRHSPRARILYNVADLHFLRLRRQAELEDDPALHAAAERMRETELAAMRLADCVIVHSAAESALLKQAAPDIDVQVVPWTVALRQTGTAAAGQGTFAFVGGYRHPPNVDAAKWAAERIMPLVRGRMEEAELLLVGSHMPPEVTALAARDVVPIGYVPTLDGIFARVRLTIAPLRYGAGLKGKVLDSLAAGVPCVMTSVAAEGLNLPAELQPFVVDEPEEFAERIALLCRDDREHRRAAEAARAHVLANYSAERIDGLMRAACGLR